MSNVSQLTYLCRAVCQVPLIFTSKGVSRCTPDWYNHQVFTIMSVRCISFIHPCARVCNLTLARTVCLFYSSQQSIINLHLHARAYFLQYAHARTPIQVCRPHDRSIYNSPVVDIDIIYILVTLLHNVQVANARAATIIWAVHHSLRDTQPPVPSWRLRI